MLKLSLSALIVTLLSASTTAHADEKSDLVAQFKLYVDEPLAFDQWRWAPEVSFELDPAACMPLVEKMRAAGIADDDRFPGYMSDTWRFKQAPKLCEKYHGYYREFHASKAVNEVSSLIEGEVKEYDERHVEFLEKCVATLDKLVADGLPTDVTITANVYTNKEMTVADAKKACADLITKAKEHIERKQKEAEAAYDAEVAKWAKLGVSGDRLKLVMGGRAYFLKGCEETSDPKKLAKAKVLFQFWGNDYDLNMQVKTWRLKGNKVVKHTAVMWRTGDMHRACK